MSEIARLSDGIASEAAADYCRTVKAGNLVAVAGTTGTDQSGSVIGINQMYVQARQAIENIARALGKAGLTLENVIRTRMFVTDISRVEEVARAHREAFGAAPPASTLVEVRRLVHPDMMIEIEADACANERVDVAAGESAAPEIPSRPETKLPPGPRGKPQSVKRGTVTAKPKAKKVGRRAERAAKRPSKRR